MKAVPHVESQIALRYEREFLRRFKIACLERDLSVTHVLGKLMAEQLCAWKHGAGDLIAPCHEMPEDQETR